MMLASVTGQLTTWVAAHGVLAVFVLMAIDAVLPIGGEVVMLYAGVIAAGVVRSAHPTFLGGSIGHGAKAYVILALAGTVGSLVGSIAAWWLGRQGGRPLIERYGRWLHVTPAKFERAERWFHRYGNLTLLVGRLTPLVRSFISIPAGVLGAELLTFTLLTLIASLIWCFGFAAGGWALAGAWHSFDTSFRYVDYAVLGVVVAVAAFLVFRLRGGRAQAADRPGEP